MNAELIKQDLLDLKNSINAKIDSIILNLTSLPAAPKPIKLEMTAAANGLTYEQYKESGWTDEQMITAGIAQKPIFA